MRTTSLKFNGDTFAAKALADMEVNRLLENFRKETSFQALQQNKQTVNFIGGPFDGAHVTMTTQFGIETAEIFVPPREQVVTDSKPAQQTSAQAQQTIVRPEIIESPVPVFDLCLTDWSDAGFMVSPKWKPRFHQGSGETVKIYLPPPASGDDFTYTINELLKVGERDIMFEDADAQQVTDTISWSPGGWFELKSMGEVTGVSGLVGPNLGGTYWDPASQVYVEMCTGEWSALYHVLRDYDLYAFDLGIPYGSSEGNNQTGWLFNPDTVYDDPWSIREYYVRSGYYTRTVSCDIYRDVISEIWTEGPSFNIREPSDLKQRLSGTRSEAQVNYIDFNGTRLVEGNETDIYTVDRTTSVIGWFDPDSGMYSPQGSIDGTATTTYEMTYYWLYADAVWTSELYMALYSKHYHRKISRDDWSGATSSDDSSETVLEEVIYTEMYVNIEGTEHLIFRKEGSSFSVNVVTYDIFDYHGRPVYIYSVTDSTDALAQTYYGMYYNGTVDQAGPFPGTDAAHRYHDVGNIVNNLAKYANTEARAASLLQMRDIATTVDFPA